MSNKLKIFFVLALTSLLIYTSCSKDMPLTVSSSGYKTQNIIIIVVDGARYTETWGDPSYQFVPYCAALLKEGVICNKFYNNGTTATNPGHSAVCTGVYQNIDNSGLEYPANPSVFQCWLKQSGHPAAEAWVITTKDKLEVLSNCTNPDWKDMHRPMTNCGVSGLFNGYTQDSITMKRVLHTLSTQQVRLMLVNFKQPDESAHSGDSLSYLQGIRDTDKYIDQIWKQIQSDELYKNITTLIVTNDHGRHTAGYLDGFVSHGDTCNGCRHIEFFAIGPDFKQNYISNVNYEQIDIANTVAELMGFKMPYAKGKVMRDVFQ